MKHLMTGIQPTVTLTQPQYARMKGSQCSQTPLQWITPTWNPKSRTDLHTHSQCSGFTDQWGLCPKIYIMRKARDSEFERILMSKSVHHCYQDDSYVDPDCTRSIYTQMDNGLQINLTNSNITALCSIYGNNLGLHPQYTSPATSNSNAATRHPGS